ncbi:hypothetical protein L195_g051442 [Trifolium pratense]|uniref:Uncharacterized protein n=1 Tax=Trifolium pratense TaxID=57577 RepID=A0A2K3JZK9_TRIPR|nr:hypothetical protein L195_g051442 [Trifolium pratense]
MGRWDEKFSIYCGQVLGHELSYVVEMEKWGDQVVGCGSLIQGENGNCSKHLRCRPGSSAAGLPAAVPAAAS